MGQVTPEREPVLPERVRALPRHFAWWSALPPEAARARSSVSWSPSSIPATSAPSASPARGSASWRSSRRSPTTWCLEMSFRKANAVKFLAAGLKKLAAQAPWPVLVLDEAQNVPTAAIDQIRLVAEEAIPPLLGMVLAGDETFRRTLQKHANAPLSGRLSVRIRLAPMTAQESEAFIAHGWKTAGMQNILAPTALGAIHAASGGSPREVGAILSRSMVLALEKQSRLLSDEIVQCWRRRKMGPLMAVTAGATR